MKSIYILCIILLQSGVIFSQQNFDNILREIDMKKKEIGPFYNSLSNQYKIKQEALNQNLNKKVNQLTAQITTIDTRLLALEVDYTKYKKQGELYDALLKYHNDHNYSLKRLYENKSDLKWFTKFLKNSGISKKKAKLIFAVWAYPKSNTNRGQSAKVPISAFYFWSDGTIDSHSYKENSFPFNGSYTFTSNYDQSEKIKQDLDEKLINKTISYLKFDDGLKIKLEIQRLAQEKKSLTDLLLSEKSIYDNEMGKFNLDTLKFQRTQDSLKLIELEIYYKALTEEQLEQQREINKMTPLNYSKYKTTKVNGVEVFNSPLSINQFRNGDPIMLARTQSEWDKFMNSNVPAYKFKDFDEKNASYGFIYNYHAYIDSREIAPYGFHKLNLQDYNYLDKQVVYNSTKLEECHQCNNGRQENYEWCSHCIHWTKEQRKYNVCKYCNNNSLKITGTKICSECNGTGKFKSISLKGREIPIMPGTSLNKGLFFNGYYRKFYTTVVEDGRMEDVSRYKTHFFRKSNTKWIWDGREVEFQIFICKDREIKKTNDNLNFKQIGNLEIMSDFLNVTSFKNGDPIRYIEDPIDWELAIKNKIPAYCYYMNQTNSSWVIYNEIALADPRGLVPHGWRKITEADVVHLSFELGVEFDIRSQFVYGKDYPGFRQPNGEFNKYDRKEYHYTDYYYNPNQYVICVRDSPQNGNKTPLSKISLNMDRLLHEDKNESNNKYENRDVSNSKLILNYANWREHGITNVPDKNSFAIDYSKYYNDEGVEFISDLVKNNFENLFQKNKRLEIIGYSELLFCSYGKFEQPSAYDERLVGLIIEQGSNDNEIKCTYVIKACGRSVYENDKKNNGQVLTSIFYRSSEFTYTNDNGINLTFHFSPQMNCKPSNNPLENLIIEFDRCYGKNKDWLSTEDFPDPYGYFRIEVIPHVKEINQFFEKN